MEIFTLTQWLGASAKKQSASSFKKDFTEEQVKSGIIAFIVGLISTLPVWCINFIFAGFAMPLTLAPFFLIGAGLMLYLRLGTAGSSAWSSNLLLEKQKKDFRENKKGKIFYCGKEFNPLKCFPFMIIKSSVPVKNIETIKLNQIRDFYKGKENNEFKPEPDYEKYNAPLFAK